MFYTDIVPSGANFQKIKGQIKFFSNLRPW